MHGRATATKERERREGGGVGSGGPLDAVRVLVAANHLPHSAPTASEGHSGCAAEMTRRKYAPHDPAHTGRAPHPNAHDDSDGSLTTDGVQHGARQRMRRLHFPASGRGGDVTRSSRGGTGGREGGCLLEGEGVEGVAHEGVARVEGAVDVDRLRRHSARA